MAPIPAIARGSDVDAPTDALSDRRRAMNVRPSQPSTLTLTSLMRWMSQQRTDTRPSVSLGDQLPVKLRLVEPQASLGSGPGADPYRVKELDR